MLAIPEFVEFFVFRHYQDELLNHRKSLVRERKSQKSMKLPGHKYCDIMASLCNEVSSGNFKRLRAKILRNTISKDFSRTIQHDANEFILYLFDKLQDEQTQKSAKFNSEEYTSGISAWQGYESQHLSIIDRLFTGMCQTQIE